MWYRVGWFVIWNRRTERQRKESHDKLKSTDYCNSRIKCMCGVWSNEIQILQKCIWTHHEYKYYCVCSKPVHETINVGEIKQLKDTGADQYFRIEMLWWKKFTNKVMATTKEQRINGTLVCQQKVSQAKKLVVRSIWQTGELNAMAWAGRFSAVEKTSLWL